MVNHSTDALLHLLSYLQLTIDHDIHPWRSFASRSLMFFWQLVNARKRGAQLSSLLVRLFGVGLCLLVNLD